MKNLCTKSKGKIHPTPAAGDALTVLALLPAAALALTAVLGFDDKEVVAYLITRSLNSSLCAPSEAEKKRCRKSSCAATGSGAGAGAGGAQHRPTFDCGCFDCYTSFWIRWDSSSQREVIHEVIEAFEEYLASSEKSRKKKASTSRRRDRRESSDRSIPEKGKGKKKVEEPEVVELSAAVAALAAVASCCGVEEKEVKFEVAVAEEETAIEGGVEEAEEAAESGCGGGAGGERRKVWPDVMGIFNSRLWSLWSPAA